MAQQIKALVITGFGTNCEMEMSYACRRAGALSDIAHISDVLNGAVRLTEYHFLNLAGGFLDGDDLGSAQVESVRLKYARIQTTGRTLFEEIKDFIERGMIILGVCNGFQALVKSGLLPGNPLGRRRVSLTFNDSAKFEDRWVRLAVDPTSPCIFTRGIDRLYLPVRHGEGKFVCESDGTLEEIRNHHLAALRYADESYSPTMEYPFNPNGAVEAIAGICDASGRIFGLMPHPEAFNHPANHPSWTRLKALPDKGDGMAIFENAVGFLKGIV
ncbi:MAG TPA: phosphoribosylformylglycinamidine synthase subunit PurQ [Deltaproteobacteria bacterium]|nr:phosphoribosylformylglycinamidine synthase subunit PurQ [Deltaproteobacteria bacterium]